MSAVYSTAEGAGVRLIVVATLGGPEAVVLGDVVFVADTGDAEANLRAAEAVMRAADAESLRALSESPMRKVALD